MGAERYFFRIPSLENMSKKFGVKKMPFVRISRTQIKGVKLSNALRP
jgi:hypothetical protein